MQTYTVQSGDSLSKIAAQVLGDPMRYPELYEYNTWIDQETSIIHPGDVIKYPGDDAAAADASSSTEEASSGFSLPELSKEAWYGIAAGGLVLASLFLIKPKKAAA